MILIIIVCLSAGAAIGFITAALLQAGADRRNEPPHTEPTKLLTVGCSVKHHGRVYGKSPFLCVADNVTAEYEVVGNIHDNPELLEVTE